MNKEQILKDILDNDIEVSKDRFVDVVKLIITPKRPHSTEHELFEFKLRDTRGKPFWKFW
tara:strand:- start:873 stop:1052 length:180 start_codon:yes stop_codon:yes gene_type:complete